MEREKKVRNNPSYILFCFCFVPAGKDRRGEGVRLRVQDSRTKKKDQKSLGAILTGETNIQVREKIILGG